MTVKVARVTTETIVVLQRFCVPSQCAVGWCSGLEALAWRVVCAVMIGDADSDMYVPMVAIGASPAAWLAGGNMGSAAEWRVRLDAVHVRGWCVVSYLGTLISVTRRVEVA